MALRDDLMVVVPESIRDETSWTSPKLVQVVRNLAMITRGRPYYTETVHNWLKSFETDPETLIEMPNGCKGGSILNGPVGESLSIGYLRLMRDDKYRDGWAEDTRHFLDTFETIEPSAFDPLIKVPAGIEVDLGIKGPRYLSALQRMGLDCGTKHGQVWLAKAIALADDIEIVIPEEVLAEGVFCVPIVGVGANRMTAAVWERHREWQAKNPKTAAFLKHFAPKSAGLPPNAVELSREKVPDGPGEVIHYRQMTRLERVAAGLEKPVEKAYLKEHDACNVVYYHAGDLDAASCGTRKVPEFRLRSYRQILTLEPDDSTGDDVAMDASSDRYFGVKR